jgi:hypothetical protein
MKINVALFLILTGALAAGCRSSPPYRTGLPLDSSNEDRCQPVYYAARWDLDRDLTVDNPKIRTIQDKIQADRKDPLLADCWNTSREHHAHFDLYSIEFDDQGWLAELGGKPDSNRARDTQLTTLVNDLEKMVHEEHHPLSIIIYTHGWHHSAAPDDNNVIAFRQLLEDSWQVETVLCSQTRNNPDCKDSESGSAAVGTRKIVGIYVGWRGDSVYGLGPLIDDSSIWDRKNTAEIVAQGSVQEFFARMHAFFLAHACHLMSDPSRRAQCSQRLADVRMLTVGHSFGGLITYRALGPRLTLGITETTYTLGEECQQTFAYGFGDLTVLINPAFEATRFESLAEAAACRKYVASDATTACGPLPRCAPDRELPEWQLPVLIVATSRTDRATGWFFPIFRRATTLIERVRGAERAANVKAVGWDQRYQTHSLAFGDDPKACRGGRAKTLRERLGPELNWSEAQHTDHYKSFDAAELELPECLRLTKVTEHAWENRPPFMPLWVIKADESVINGHNDFLNPHFIDFVRQIYFTILQESQPELKEKQTASAPPDYHGSSQ